MYSLYKALHYIKENKKIYLFIIVQMTLSLTIILLNLNSSWVAKQRIAEYQDNLAQQKVSLRVYSNQSINNEGENVFTPPALYHKLVKTYGDRCEILYFVGTNISYFNPENQSIYSSTCLFMPKETFRVIFNQEMDSQTAYVGDACFPSKSCTYNSLTAWFDYNDKGIVTSDQVRRDDLMPTKANTALLTRGVIESFSIDLATTLVLPIDWLDEQVCQSDDYLNSEIKLFSDDPSVYTEILDFVTQEADENTYYELSYDYYQLKDSLNDLQIDIRVMTALANFILLVSFVGAVGVLLVFLESRKKDFAISIAYGATIETVYLELFLEIMLVLLAVSGLSLIATAFFASMLSTAVYTVSFSLWSIPIAILFMLVVAILVTMIALFSIRKLTPVEILCGDH